MASRLGRLTRGRYASGLSPVYRRHRMFCLLIRNVQCCRSGLALSFPLHTFQLDAVAIQMSPHYHDNTQSLLQVSRLELCHQSCKARRLVSSCFHHSKGLKRPQAYSESYQGCRPDTIVSIDTVRLRHGTHMWRLCNLKVIPSHIVESILCPRK